MAPGEENVKSDFLHAAPPQPKKRRRYVCGWGARFCQRELERHSVIRVTPNAGNG